MTTAMPTVRELIIALLDFDPDAVVAAQVYTTSKVALVAIPNDGEEVDKRSGRFAAPDDTVLILTNL